MKREHVLDLSRRVGSVTGTSAPVIVGSQSLYALTDDVPDLVKRSIECDFLIVGAGREAFRTVTEEFGLASGRAAYRLGGAAGAARGRRRDALCLLHRGA